MGEQEELDGMEKVKEENGEEKWITTTKGKKKSNEKKHTEVKKGKYDDVCEEEVDEVENFAASEFTCFEDVLEVVGSRGRWNMCLFFLCGFCEY